MERKRPKARLKNSPHPGNETLRGGQSPLFFILFQFGKALEPEGSMKKMGKRTGRERSPAERAGVFYVWWAKNTEVWLSYSKDRYKGTLTMNSRKVSEERRDYQKQKEKERKEKERKEKERGF